MSTANPNSPSRLNAAWLAAVSFGFLLFVGISVSTHSVRSSVVSFLDIQREVPPPKVTPTDPPPPQQKTDPLLGPFQNNHQTQGWLNSLFLIAAITVAVAIILLVIFAALTLWTRKRSKLNTADMQPTFLSKKQAEEAFKSSRFKFDSIAKASHAVIAAWIQLEAALTRFGVKRKTADTTESYVTDALQHLDLDEAALRGFADLFRQARYGRLEDSDASRQQALNYLDRLQSSLSTEEAK